MFVQIMLQVIHELLHINPSIMITADNIEYNYILIVYTNIVNSAISYYILFFNRATKSFPQ